MVITPNQIKWGAGVFIALIILGFVYFKGKGSSQQLQQGPQIVYLPQQGSDSGDGVVTTVLKTVLGVLF